MLGIDALTRLEGNESPVATSEHIVIVGTGQAGGWAAQTLRKEGTQKNAVPTMQSRADLYDYLGYHTYENKLDALFSMGKGK